MDDIKRTWHYMASGKIVITEVGEPLRIIDPQEDGYIRFQLQTEGPAMLDPPMRLATAEENSNWIFGGL